MANEYLKRTPTSTGNRRTWTLALWLKRNVVEGDTGADAIFNAANTAANSHGTDIRFRKDNTNANNSWNFYDYNANVFTWGQYGASEYRDCGNWFHAMFVFDSTQGNSSDRVRVYINGVLDNFYESSPAVDPSQDYESYVNSVTEHYLGVDQFAGSLTTSYSKNQFSDVFLVDGQALTPEVFGFYKDGNGYISAGSTVSTDFRNGQWVPRTPREIKNLINDNGGFGVNGFYLPMNDSSNFGADFHTTPNSIITLKGENLPQPRNGAPDTTDDYVSQLRSDPYAANLVLAVPGIELENTNPELVTNGDFSQGTYGWIGLSGGVLSAEGGKLKITETTGSVDAYACNSATITTEIGKRYTIKWTFHEGTNTSFTVRFGHGGNQLQQYQSNTGSNGYGSYPDPGTYSFTFTAVATTLNLSFIVNQPDTYGYVSNVSVKEAIPVRDYSADIKGSGTNKTLTGISTAGIYPVPSYYGSAMKFDGEGDVLTLSNDTDFHLGSGDYTIECWINPDNFDNIHTIFALFEQTPERAYNLEIRPDGTPLWQWYQTDGTSGANLNPSVTLAAGQWTHLAAERYGTDTTLYVNGVAAGINTNAPLGIYSNTSEPFTIGALRFNNAYAQAFPGKIQDLRFYKGVAKYKGGFDVPKPYAPVGIGTWRAVSDECKDNFATLNAQLNVSTLTEGNLKTVTAGNNSRFWANTAFPKTGKWYTEFSLLEGDLSLTFAEYPQNANKQYSADADGFIAYLYYAMNGNNRIYYNSFNHAYAPSGWEGSKIVNGVATYGSVGEIIGVCVDQDNNTITITNHSGDFTFPTPSGLQGKSFHIGYSVITTWPATTYVWNFGQNPTFGGRELAGTYTDANGKGLFKRQPPTGSLALCQSNFPDPTIKDPGEHFKTVLYTGDGTSDTTSIKGFGFKPDLIWVKGRGFVGNHAIWDSVRGATKRLSPNLSDTESTSDGVTSFDYDGFSRGSAFSASGNFYVAWGWKAGGDAVLNNNGTIPSQVSTNQTAGFSIVKWESKGSNTSTETVGHGLNSKPDFIILKNTDASTNWRVYHSELGTEALTLNETEASYSFWPSEPNDSVITLANSTTTGEASGYGNDTIIAYCWKEIEGYSKFGSYIGNASTDGPFIYCGFKPAFVIIKGASASATYQTYQSWAIKDSARYSTNRSDPPTLWANRDYPEGKRGQGSSDTYVEAFDFLSNGFKISSTSSYEVEINELDKTYIFAAFAESPFKYANAK